VITSRTPRGDGDALVRANADDVNDGELRVGVTRNERAPNDVRIESLDSTSQLGLPDLLFFALFLAAAERFGLRRGATWLAMALSFGLTLVGAYVFDAGGLPALPLLAFGFLLPNADVLWRAFRTRRRGDEPAGADPPPP